LSFPNHKYCDGDSPCLIDMPYPPRSMVRIVLFVLATMLLFFVSTQHDSVRSMARFVSGPSMSYQERVELVEKLQELKHILAEYFPIDAKE
jgi:hypothetical protein